MAELKGHVDQVTCAAFSPDGRIVVTASKDHTARLWNLTGDPLAELRGHGDGVTYAVFSPDGKSVLTTSEDGSARLWPCHVCGDPGVMVGEMSRRVGRDLMTEGRRLYGLPAVR